MIWPWVSRVAHELELRGVRATAQAMCDDYRRSEQAAYDRYGDLLTKYHELRQQGFAVPAEMKALPPVVVTPELLIGRAIDAIPASRDPKNRSLMWRQAKADQLAGVSPEEIIMRIQRGTRPAEELE